MFLIASVSLFIGLMVMGLTAAALVGRQGQFRSQYGGIFHRLLSGIILAPRRRARIVRQLPGALLSLASSIRAGLSLPQAIRAAGNSLPRPLGPYFTLMDEEISRGATLDETLSGFARRVSLPEVRMMAAGLKIARVSGGSIAPLLDQLAAAMRERESLRGRIRSLTAQGRLSGWVVGSIPPVLLLAIWMIDPEFVRPLLATPIGWGLLCLAACLELLGALAIRAIVRIET